MAITSAPYAGFLLGLPKGQFNLLGGNIQVSLAGSGYLPNMTTHTYLTDVTDQVSAATPKILSGVGLTYDETTFTVKAAADPVVWEVATFTARWAVLYQWAGSAGSSRLIGYIDFDAAREYDAEDFTLSFPDGFAQIPAA